MIHKAWSSIEEVSYRFSMSSVKFQGRMGHKIIDFDWNWAFSNCTDGYEMMHKAWSSIEEVPYYFSRSSIKFQGHSGKQKSQILSWIQVFLGWLAQFESTNGVEMMHKAWCSVEEVPVNFQSSSSNFKVTWGKRSSILTQIGCFQTVNPVWIHWWLWNAARSLM